MVLLGKWHGDLAVVIAVGVVVVVAVVTLSL